MLLLSHDATNLGASTTTQGNDMNAQVKAMWEVKVVIVGRAYRKYVGGQLVSERIGMMAGPKGHLPK